MSNDIEWPVRAFAKVADYDVGRTPARANDSFWDQSLDGIPWVTISDLEPYGTVNATKETTTRVAFQKVFRGKCVPANTLMMSFKLTIGRVATLGIPAVHNEAIISIYPKPGMDQRFLGYYLSQVDYSQLQDRQIKGNTLNKSKIDRIPVPVPPNEEQLAIVGILDTVREAIATDREALGAVQALKRAVGHQVFTVPTEPVNDNAAAPGWVIERIGDNHRVSSGGTPSRSVPEYWADGTIPWVKTTEVDYTVITSVSERITQQGLDNSAAKVLPAGTVLLAMYGQGVTRGKVAILGIEAAFNQACAAIQATSEAVDVRYLYHYLTHQYDELRHMAHGGQQQNLNLDIIRTFPIIYPQALESQAVIVELLDALDEKLRFYEHRLPVLDALFIALLTGFMSRQIAVGDVATAQFATPTTEKGSAA
jgi:type I restriction enzyme S subunit